MKNIKKNLLKSLVLIALFAPATFADGEMGGGGLGGPVESPQVSKVVVTQTIEDREMTTDPSYLDAIMKVLCDYFEMTS